MFSITLPITVPAYSRSKYERAFRALSKIHNAVVSYAIGRMNVLNQNKEYLELKKQCAKTGPTPKLTSRMNKIVKDTGLSKSSLEKFAKKIGARHNTLLSSQQVQKEVSHVWAGVEKVLYSNGKKLNYKRSFDFDTIPGKSNKNGARFNPKDLTFKWIGETYQCTVPKNMDAWYLEAALKNKISYCEIKRMMFPNGWKYYLIVVLHGESPLIHEHANGGTMGIDMGTSTVAGVSMNNLFLEILANGVEKYREELALLSMRMDASRRAANPNKYNPNGTFKKGNKDKWVFSSNYWKMRCRFKSLNRQRSAFIKYSHRALANKMIRCAVNFVFEKMNFQGLARRSKTTKRESKPKIIVGKNGVIRFTRKYIRKKRFGHSILERAPSMFLTILTGKARRYGGEPASVETTSFRASQYDHISDTYAKTGLGQRFKQIGESTVQRDLYSAFLLLNTDASLKFADRERCDAGFANFVKLQNEALTKMKVSGISRKSCFGF